MIAWLFSAAFGHIEPTPPPQNHSTITEAQQALHRADDDMQKVREQQVEAIRNTATLRSIQVNAGLGGDITTSMRRPSRS